MSKIHVPMIFDDEDVYVEGMTTHAQLDETFEGVFELTDLLAASATNLLGTTAVVAGASVAVDIAVDAFFGRTVRAASAGTGSITLIGKDYLNQVISQTVALANNNVTTLKAFKSIHRITSVDLTSNITLGCGAAIGLPFTARAILSEYSGNTAQTLGTFVAPVTTKPATAATGDPRGTYIPGTTLNGANDLIIKAVFNPDSLDGLYGVRGA